MLEVKVEEPQTPAQDERITYRLVRIDENGLYCPVTDEDLMEVESLIQAEVFDEENEQDHTDQDDEKDSAPMDVDPYEDVKMRLLKQLEVVDTMLLKVKTEEDQRASMECTGNGGYNGAKFTYKRRRRPNPKYFTNTSPSFDTVELVPAPADGPLHLVSSQMMMALDSSTPKFPELDDQQQQQFCSSSKPVNPQPDTTPTTFSQHPILFLDNLSIRALQDTYRDTFGKETSAKDKHWLKRKIAKGLSALGSCSVVDGATVGIQQVIVQETFPRERADGAAEQPFVCSNEEVKPKVSSISPTASLDASTTTVVSRPSDGGCQSNLNEVQSLEGSKRHRKPNRRYVEDEADEASFGRTAPSASSPENLQLQLYHENENENENEQELELEQEQSLDPEFCWKSDDEEDEDDDFDDEALEYSDPLDSLSPDNDGLFSSRKRSRSFGAERRAVQLVKMARNARAIRKIKFKLPSAQGQDNDENYEPNDDSADQVSCMLPSISDELQPSDTEDVDVDRKSGSRRKHHRPWTLKEVIALVDGVARCGTGKWADIKRLSFAAIAYRTPVDLKDKWRNLLRASRVHSHTSRQQGEKRRKHFSVSIPPNVLAKVRELAAQPGQTVKVPVMRATRSRRMMQRQNKL